MKPNIKVVQRNIGLKKKSFSYTLFSSESSITLYTINTILKNKTFISFPSTGVDKIKSEAIMVTSLTIIGSVVDG
jgi:hypothetical protein